MLVSLRGTPCVIRRLTNLPQSRLSRPRRSVSEHFDDLSLDPSCKPIMKLGDLLQFRIQSPPDPLHSFTQRQTIAISEYRFACELL